MGDGENTRTRNGVGWVGMNPDPTRFCVRRAVFIVDGWLIYVVKCDHSGGEGKQLRKRLISLPL